MECNLIGTEEKSHSVIEKEVGSTLIDNVIVSREEEHEDSRPLQNSSQPWFYLFLGTFVGTGQPHGILRPTTQTYIRDGRDRLCKYFVVSFI